MKHLEQRKWMESGPFFTWRTSPKRRLTQSMAALHIGVTMMTWQLWERGLGRPGRDNMVLLKHKIGIEDIGEQIEKWMARRPQLQHEGEELS